MQETAAEIENNDDLDKIDLSQRGSAFNYLSLSVYARSPSGSRLFRVQHSELLMNFDEVLVMAHAGRSNALDLRNKLTTLTSQLTVHFSMEENIIYKQMMQDPRARSIAEQFERELSAVRTSVHSYLKKYATPSFIANNLPEFIEDTEQQARHLQDRFKSEERELFVAYDRLARGGYGA